MTTTAAEQTDGAGGTAQGCQADPSTSAPPSGPTPAASKGKYHIYTRGREPDLDGRSEAGHERLRQRSEETPLSYFQKLFTPAIVDNTVDCTDYYARTFGTRTTKKRWTNLMTGELLCVIGIIIFMGLVQLPQQGDYWKPEPKGFSLPIVNYMSYDRFTSIVRNLAHTTNDKSRRRESGDVRRLRDAP